MVGDVSLNELIQRIFPLYGGGDTTLQTGGGGHYMQTGGDTTFADCRLRFKMFRKCVAILKLCAFI